MHQDTIKDMDVISIILEDHKPLKDLIQVMKDSELPLEERKEAYSEFVPLLTAHAKPEEKSLYEFLKTIDFFRMEAMEGEAEHGLADQMAEEAKRASDNDQLSAKIKILAELVEHHIKEEEEELFPEVKKQVSRDDLVRIAKKYTEVQEGIFAEGIDDSPTERNLDVNGNYQAYTPH